MRYGLQQPEAATQPSGITARPLLEQAAKMIRRFPFVAREPLHSLACASQARTRADAIAQAHERESRAAAGASAVYFLNRLSKAALASFTVRGAITVFAGSGLVPPATIVGASRATVTRGENISHSFVWSFTAIRIGIGFRH
jgi:hypothetical protein